MGGCTAQIRYSYLLDMNRRDLNSVKFREEETTVYTDYYYM